MNPSVSRSRFEHWQRIAAVSWLAFFGLYVPSHETWAATEPPTKLDSSTTASRYQLKWSRETGAEGCISGAALERLLVNVLDDESQLLSIPPLVLEGTASIATAPERYRIRIRVTDERGSFVGERKLTTADSKCSSLSSAVLLVLVMALAPDRVRFGLPPTTLDELGRTEREDTDEWPKQTPTPPTASPHEPRLTLAEASPKHTQRSRCYDGFVSRYEVTLHSGLSTGLLPSVSSGFGFGLRNELNLNWSVKGSVSYWLPSAIVLPPPRGGVVRFSAFSFLSHLCRSLTLARDVSLAGCAGLFLGFRFITSNTLEAKRRPVQIQLGPALALENRVSLGKHWVAVGQLGAQAAIRKDYFTYEDYQGDSRELYRPSLVSADISLGIGRIW